ncbi:MAG TPA: hypothetical protein VF116_14365 [Ktedonobacterales bacterium]
MAKSPRTQDAPVVRTSQALQPPRGSVRACALYRGELARHRVITSDGCDYVVATVGEGRLGSLPFVTGAYPVVRGYLVMMRQPLYEVRSPDEDAALDEHERLVRVLAEAGVKVVRARKQLAARQRAEARDAMAAADPAIIELRVGKSSARDAEPALS